MYIHCTFLKKYECFTKLTLEIEILFPLKNMNRLVPLFKPLNEV